MKIRLRHTSLSIMHKTDVARIQRLHRIRMNWKRFSCETNWWFVCDCTERTEERAARILRGSESTAEDELRTSLAFCVTLSQHFCCSNVRISRERQYVIWLSVVRIRQALYALQMENIDMHAPRSVCDWTLQLLNNLYLVCLMPQSKQNNQTERSFNMPTMDHTVSSLESSQLVR